jgi:hypothetical protein
MAHWLALKLGVITLDEARHLQGLKLSNHEEYEREEYRLGATRAQLEKLFGKEVVDSVDALPSNYRYPYPKDWRTNRRTGRRFRN